MSSLRVLVVQNGARHNYAVPTVLAQAGMLEAFYTDACGSVGLGRWLAAGRHLPWVGAPLVRLHKRQLPPLIVPRTKAFAGGALADAVAGRVIGGNSPRRFVGGQMLRQGLRRANLVYSSLGWGSALLREARSRGVPVVTEFYARPSLVKVYQDEYRAFPGWEAELPLQEHMDRVGTAFDPCTVSDFVIAPCDQVADEVAAIHGFPRDRVEVVPYGIDDTFFAIENRPVVGRVLFAGTCCLWKGIHYFAMAAERLAAAGKNYEFRVAGGVTPLIRSQPPCRHLTFLGRVPREEMKREYAAADVMVLPTLADSFGVVQLEAIAAGVPVITTRTAGSVVRDGIDGLLVPERDPAALAEAVVRVVEDRSMRERMAIAARERAREFTWERYGERLIDLFTAVAERRE